MEQYLDDSTLEKILKENSHKKYINELKKRQLKKFFSEGEHYLSVTWQETAIVSNENGNIWKENLIVKAVPKSDLAKQFVENEGIFKKEIIVYNDILKLMENQLNNCEIGGELLWPKCIGTQPHNIIILEDLISKGFRKVDRQEGLDLEHAILAFKAIAKFHVLSLTIKDRITKNENQFITFPFGTFSPKRYEFFKSKIRELTNTMFNKWDTKWHKLAECLQTNFEELYSLFIKKCKIDENNFNVLNHGDLWTSNLLFKHCEFTDKLIGIRFVDYQMTHYCSFALDLQYILQTSIKPDVRKHHTEDLLIAYHETLLKTARKLDLANIVIPSINAIKTEMTDKILIGIFLTIYLLDVMLVEPSDAANLETLLNDGFDKFSKIVMTSDLYENRMQAILEPYIDTDLRCL